MEAQTAFVLFVAVVAVAILLSRLRPAPKGGDQAITSAINEALRKEFVFANIQVDVKTFDGAVILGGFVREYEQAKRAVEIASATPGVKSVESRISVTPGG